MFGGFGFLGLGFFEKFSNMGLVLVFGQWFCPFGVSGGSLGGKGVLLSFGDLGSGVLEKFSKVGFCCFGFGVGWVMVVNKHKSSHDDGFHGGDVCKCLKF